MHWYTGWPAITLLSIEWLARLGLAVHVILRRRAVATSLAWLAIILFVPILGMLVYFMVGGSSLGTRRARRYKKVTERLRRLAAEIMETRRPKVSPVAPELEPIARFGTAMTGLPPLPGNTLRLFGDNAAMLGSLRADIDAATHHIHMCYYIWMPDRSGAIIAEALAAAVGRGVIVRVLVDGAGSHAFLRHQQSAAMRAAGIQVVEALPVSVLRLPFARIDLRNHRKIAVFDGRVGYCGSQNIHDVEYSSPRWAKAIGTGGSGSGSSGRGRWIDATVRVEGPAAQALAATFLRDWKLDSEEPFEDLGPYLPEPRFELRDVDGNTSAGAAVQVVASGPGPTPQAIHQALLTALYAARKEIVMTTPYFVPDASLLEAITAAATRGVRVVMVLPDVSDAPIVAAAGRAHYEDLLDAGVELHEYLGGLLHSKVITVDSKMGVVGSANMDQRSFFLNFEATMFVYDAAFAGELVALQRAYLKTSRRVSAEEWSQRSVWARLRDNSARLMGPLL
ncbi:MAG TPA: cardiolipin synthase [Phycisphaerales bacterium]|mgnify:CR=1 FL=1|nr:cardiolipin synthase [Phycisphaerales bacterium]